MDTAIGHIYIYYIYIFIYHIYIFIGQWILKDALEQEINKYVTHLTETGTNIIAPTTDENMSDVNSEVDDKILIITPVEGAGEKEADLIQQSIRSKNLPTKKLFKKPNGDVLLQCREKRNRQEALDILKEDFGSKISIKEDKVLTKLEFTVERERGDLPDKEALTQELLQDNEIDKYVHDSTLKVLITRKTRRGVVVIMLVDSMTKKFLSQHNLNKIKWNHGQYSLKDHMYVKYCFHCQGYGHWKKDCRNVAACKRCAGNHSVWECQNNVHSCVNCKKANIQYGRNYNIWHMAHHRDLCPSYRAVYNRERNRQL